MPTGYLRTNYRRLTGFIPMDGIGGGIPKSSAAGGVGIDAGNPYGGFIWLEICCPIVNASDNASVAGISSRAVVSTTDIMASFYGAGIFGAGYAFQPIVVYTRSIMSAAVHWTASVGAPDDSIGYVQCVSLRYSGSYAIWTPLMLMWTTASQFSLVSLSDYSGVFEVGGFIVSSPDAL
jgi:hypothetical protein